MKKTILIVEDDEAILESMTYVLEDSGFRVLQAKDCDIFIKKLKEDSVDLVILDYWLPKQNGGEIIEKIKTRKKSKNLPVVVMSASQNIKETVLALGADDFIAKPFDIDYLVKTIKRHLNS